MKAELIRIAAVTFALMTASQAMGRERDRREGFNFGTTVRIMNTDDRTHGTDESGRETKSETSSSAVNPYIGWAFESFNLGLVYSQEMRTSQSSEESEDGLTTTERQTSQASKGASLFMRFLFGRVFFFEAGAGLYTDKIEVKTERKVSQGNGSFTGDEDTYTVSGVGPGYHLAGGLELSMGGGFFFTSAWQVRMVQLRDHDGGSDLGAKRSQTQKREVLFGLAHYHR